MELLVVQLLLTLGLAVLLFLAIFRLTTRNSRPAPTPTVVTDPDIARLMLSDHAHC